MYFLPQNREKYRLLQVSKSRYHDIVPFLVLFQMKLGHLLVCRFGTLAVHLIKGVRSQV